MPVGSSKERVADVRIVAATNENMEKAIADGRFREDLYHRLGEFEIRQPSLAECPEDILPLADFFRKKFSSELRKATEGFTAEAERLLLSHSWSGNIRELQNKIRRAVLMAKDTLIDYADLNITPAIQTDASEAPLLPLRMRNWRNRASSEPCSRVAASRQKRPKCSRLIHPHCTAR